MLDWRKRNVSPELYKQIVNDAGCAFLTVIGSIFSWRSANSCLVFFSSSALKFFIVFGVCGLKYVVCWRLFSRQSQLFFDFDLFQIFDQFLILMWLHLVDKMLADFIQFLNFHCYFW